MRSLSAGERTILIQDGAEEPDQWRILSERQLLARKSHECDGCKGTCFAQHIRSGEFYSRVVVIEDGEFKVLRLCSGTPKGDGC